MSERARPAGAHLPPGAVPGVRSADLADGWTLASTSPGAHATPVELPADVVWRPAVVPGTVAQAVGGGAVDTHEHYDAHDWWYRCTVPAPEGEEGTRTRLRFDGLATLAEVWFNGERVLESANMFCAWEVDVTDLLRPDNELVLVFRSLGAALTERRPRPRWKTRLVKEQRLRWFRTTLLGRIPGWTPAIEPVGPWRAVRFETATAVHVADLDVRADVADGHGLVDVRATLAPGTPSDGLGGARLRLGDERHELEADDDGGAWAVHGSIRVPDPALWWPRTHGDPALYDCALELDTTSGMVTIDCGRIGFRALEVDRTDGRIHLLVNGVPVFCRGACWTTNDIVSLVGSPDRMRATLELMADASANMVRLGGTMVYETDDFYRACDELGLMVWQDFMFANMDYPVGDEAFAASIGLEAEHQLRRLAPHPSVVAFCGGSEVEQQAAMVGAPREVWSNDFFSRTLPALVERHAPDRAYWPSTPTGGALPFHVGEGLAHYFGVGAYMRPLDDARLSGVKFSPECLGLSNVPEPDNLRSLAADGPVPPHHPAWKAGVPRDSGAGWDFEDVRDHWLRELYGVEPVALRSYDLERYLRLSRTVTGRVMATVFDEWRSPEHQCGGGLVWLLKDLRPGAGWGIIDSDGEPKPVYYYLKRAWSPVRVALLDRGLDGLRVEVHNETAEPLHAEVEVTILDAGSVVTARGSEALDVPARGTGALSVEAVLGHFADPTYAYRFGPRRHRVVAAVASFGEGVPPRTALYWTSLADDLPEASAEAEIVPGDDACALSVRATELVRDVRLEWGGWRPDDNYFDLLAGTPATIQVTRSAATESEPRGFLDAANLRGVRLPPNAETS